MTDRILDRIKFFDERSKAFPARALPTLVAAQPNLARKRIWTPGPLLDQGREGHCVGFGIAGELGATPVKLPVDDNAAHGYFFQAQAVDRREGRNYDDGATVLAGCKAMMEAGIITKYSWCFGVNDVIMAIQNHSPVVLGINWYDGMYETTPEGLVVVSGSVVGGHCIYVHGWWPAHPLFGDVFVWQNSWDHEYGAIDQAGVPSGRGFVKVEDMERLLNEDGEAVVFTDKRIAA